MDHMRISGNEPSLVINIKTSMGHHCQTHSPSAERLLE